MKRGFVSVGVDKKSLETLLSDVGTLDTRMTDNIVKMMTVVGEKVVKTAREQGSYKDRTGNLRSSIGYVVLVNGQPQAKGTSKQFSGPQGDGALGITESEALLNSLRAYYPKGITLVCVAAMEYGVYVEAVHNLDVLTFTQLQAEQMSRRLVRRVFEGKASKAS